MSEISLSSTRRWLAGLSVLSAMAFGSPAARAQGGADAPPDDGSSGAVPSGASGAVIKRPAEETETKQPVIVMPELVHFEQAAYPRAAQQAGIEADVTLLLTIDREGNVTDVEVAEPVGHGFDEAARAAALKFKFKPATRDGKPSPAKIPYRYSFTLRTVEVKAPPPKTGDLGGVVYIAGTNVPIVGAEVVVIGSDGSEQRLTTDDQGRWELRELAPGEYRVSAGAAGYQKLEFAETVAAGEEASVTYRIPPEVEGLEVVVRGERPPREVTRRTIERREIARIPGTGGDALRSIQSLPGVARPPGLAGLLIVRGSAPNDTQTFIDGTNVPLIYHFGGLSSVVPTELLDRIDFYPGNFSARYGRGMGGIVDVGLRSPNTRCNGPRGTQTDEKGCYHGMAEIDLIKTRAMLEGPIFGSDDWSFVIGGRRSWFDTWLKPVLVEAGAGVTTAPIYWDYQVMAENRISANTKWRLTAFGADDRFEILIEDPAAEDPAFGGNIRFRTASHTLQSLYTTELNRDVELSSMVSVGKQRFDFGLGSLLSFQIDSYPIEMRNEFTWKLGPGIALDTGLDFLVGPYDVFIRAPMPPRAGEPDTGPFATRRPMEADESGTIFRPAWYAEAELQFTHRLRVVPGLRLDYARDTSHADLSPRINARYDLVTATDAGEDEAEAAAAGTRRLRTTLKGGVGLYHQAPDFQETDEYWGTPGLYSNRAIHYAIGAEQEFSRHVELSVEGFYKDMTRLVSNGSEASGERYGNDGTGYVVGMETMLKYKPDKRFFGWLAYTLSRSVRQNDADSDPYLFQFDQTHNLTALGSYRLGRGWEFGARFRVVSGNMETPVIGPPSLPALYAADAGAYAPLQGELNSRRLPLFHNLDLRIDKRWQFDYWRFSTYLDLQNVYNFQAVEGTSYNYNYSATARQTGLPILPSIGVRGEF